MKYYAKETNAHYVHAIKPTAFTDCNIQSDTNNNLKKTDVAFLQEPYTIRNNVAGFPKSFKIFAYGNGKKRTAVIVNNNIDAVPIRQVSDEDATLIEISYKGLNFYTTSLYFATDRDTERDMEKLGKL